MDNEDICESVNVLPVNLLISEMLNESPNLTNFLYDFDTNKYEYSNECPSWMNTTGNCQHGSIRITQKFQNDDLVTFSSIGNLTGHAADGKISCYYFPKPLNMYNGYSPTGGEIVIEFVDKKPPGGTPLEEAERVLIFIPVDIGKKNKNSIKWFANIKTGGKSLSLNDIIPKAPFWVYNDIKLHGSCKSKKKTHGIFFLENYINIDLDDWNIFNSEHKSLGDNGVKKNDEGKQEIKGDGIGWIWYPQKKNDSSGEPVVGLPATDIMRDTSKMTVRKCCIHKNVVGTTQGPGTHNKVGDPFSLTCEPILDAEDDSPIDAKDRLEWVKDIYNGVPNEMKKMFMALVFICILVVVLMSIHIIIFKKIGLFITQNEIAGRIDN